MPITLPKKAKEAEVEEVDVYAVLKTVEKSAFHEVASEDYDGRLDQIVNLTEQAEAAKQFLADYGKLRSSLVADVEEAYAEEASPDEEIVLKSDLGVMTLGPQSNSRKIKDMEDIKEAMGNETFMKVATVTLKACDDYLTPEQKAELIETNRGARSNKFEKNHVK